MEGQSSQPPESPFAPISKISQVISDKEQKLIENEAHIIYTKLEIDKLHQATKALNELSLNLQSETELLQKETRNLDVSIEMSRKSLEVKSDMYINRKQETSRLQSEIKQQSNQYEIAYNEYKGKYKNARNAYEKYHPLFKQREQLQNENLKLEVQVKALQANICEKKKQIKRRREIHQQIFYATIVNFAKSTVNYQKSINLANCLERAEKEQLNRVQQLHDVEALAAKVNTEFRQTRLTPVSYEPPKIKNTELMADESWNELNNNNNNQNFAPASLSTCSSGFNPLDNPSQSEEMLLQIRARCEQRQQLWEKQRSFSSTSANRNQTLHTAQKNRNRQMPMFGQIPLQGQKRSAQPTNVTNQSSQFKVPKATPFYNTRNENLPFNNQQMVQKPTSNSSANDGFAAQNSKPKILSVHTIKSNEIALPMIQHSIQKPMVPDINKNFIQVISQQSPHHLLKPSQNYASPNLISQIQSQEINNANITVATLKQQSQDYQRENLFSEEINKNTLTPSTNIEKDPTQGLSYYTAQTPLQNRPENVAHKNMVAPTRYIDKGATQGSVYYTSQTQSQSQQLTQESSQGQCAITQLKLGTPQNLTGMHISGEQATATQTSSRSVDNTGATSQSSTFSQKCMQLQHLLDTELQETFYEPPPQIKTDQTADPLLTSRFFNKPKPDEPTELANQEFPPMQELMAASPTNVSKYLDTSGLSYNLGEEGNIPFDSDYSPALSPNYDGNNILTAESQTQAPGFSFSFAQPQTKQPTETIFTFSDNGATTTNPFINMF